MLLGEKLLQRVILLFHLTTENVSKILRGRICSVIPWLRAWCVTSNGKFSAPNLQEQL